MRIIFTLITSMLLFLFVSCSSKDAIIDNPNPDPTPDPEVEIQTHPRLLLFEGEESKILENINNSEFWSSTHNYIVATADRIIPQAVLERKMNGKRLSAVSQTAVRWLFCLSYAYRMTGETKYLNRAEQEMLAISNFSDWNPPHFLDVAEMTLGMAIGYDWLYDDLSVSSRKRISETIISKGLEPSLIQRYNGFLRATHNWNQVCNAGMLYGAIAIYESDPGFAQEIIDRSVETVKLAMNEYAPEGAYPEGSAYWNYGTSFNVMLLAALEKLYSTDYGLSDMPGFLETAKFFFHSITPSHRRFNYSDGSTGGVKNFLCPEMFWFANKMNDKSLLWEEFKSIENVSGDKHLTSRLIPAIMLWGIGVDKDNIPIPEKTFWSGRGVTPVAFMRSSWDETAIYTGLKVGKASTNHGHMDVGSFILESDGIRWAVDLGVSDYNTLESQGYDIWDMKQSSFRWQVFRYNNHSHNTLTVNGKLHVADAFADIDSYASSPMFMNAISDITSIFGGDLESCVRGVALIDKEYVLIQDEIKTLPDKGAKIRWQMITEATPRIIDKNILELSKNGKTLRMQVGSSASVDMQVWSTETGYDFDIPNPGTSIVGFELNLPPNTSQTIYVSLLPDNIDYPEEEFRVLSGWPKE